MRITVESHLKVFIPDCAVRTGNKRITRGNEHFRFRQKQVRGIILSLSYPSELWVEEIVTNVSSLLITLMI